MRLTLVQPPSNHEETFLLSPPLGLLSIAAAAESEGVEVGLLDFNLKGLQDARWQTSAYFYPNAYQLVQQQRPDIIGFTSMGIESHVCLELAKQLKEQNPKITTILGGPHFGAIAVEVLENYPWIDYVIAGEGEDPLKNLIRLLQKEEQVLEVDNIAYRTDEGIVFSRKSLAGRDLDELPLPAYHLVDMEEYFTLNPSKLVCFEHARGCYLKCSFCYSPQHWGHGESRKSIARILAELRPLETMGIKELFWVSDNLLNSKEHAIQISQAIQRSGMKFGWHCYGTLPQITHPVVKSLSKAGCQSIFVGVDAVTEDKKRQYKKSYFKGWNSLRPRLKLCLDHGIRPTCAFMLSPHDKADTRESTLRVAALAANLGCFVRLNALTYYNQTEIQKTTTDVNANSEYSEAYASVLFDTAEILNANKFARTNPQLFPFHQTFAGKELHEFFAGYCRLAMMVVNAHTIVNIRGITDANMWLHDVITTLRSRFELEELRCQWRATSFYQYKYFKNICELYNTLGIDNSLLIYDLQRCTPPQSKRAFVKRLRVDNQEVLCMLKPFHALNLRENPKMMCSEQILEYDKEITVLSRFEFDTYTDVAIDKKNKNAAQAIIEDKNACTEIHYELFKKLLDKNLLTPIDFRLHNPI